ncbi:hypothetical protein ElyMa_002085800 [Elysia marginata]|uniref:C-type lectin domain-containing protein n=1 Tax=Elysia marginata TaxID=1093978 RepID=A0AAV4FDG3_9GAST|nr:hypothetical protein ElyMa_002085800 [Elysia marginata]
MFSYFDLCLEAQTKESERRSWADARAYCQLNGGDLVKLSDNDRRKKFYIYGLTGELDSGEFWLGLYQSKQDGLYRWVNDLIPVRIQNKGEKSGGGGVHFVSSLYGTV